MDDPYDHAVQHTRCEEGLTARRWLSIVVGNGT